MTEAFGKFVTLVEWKCSAANWIPGAGAYHMRTVWCDNNVGRIGVEWDYFPESKTFVFSNPEDATLFKLRFGV
jgi:hypothetical protein